MGAQPCTTHWPCRPSWSTTWVPIITACWRCFGPDISIVMQYPTAANTIVNFCSLGSVNGQPFYKIKERLMKFGKISILCQPIIHFGVNVDGIVTSPWRLDMVVPYTL